MTSAHDVAEELRRRIPDIGATKLHKLLYYSAGWHLVWRGEPLFVERIEAWRNGPVVAELWADEKHGRDRPSPQVLDGQAMVTIEYVVKRYGYQPTSRLIAMTHAEDPWLDAVAGDGGAGAEITTPGLVAWFRNDDEYRWQVGETARLRERLGADPFAPAPLAGETTTFIDRVLVGEVVRQTRPE